MKKNPVIGIIGNRGKMGLLIKQLALAQGYTVIGSDLGTELKNQDVIKEADIVMISVLPSIAIKVIKELGDLFRPDQLVVEFTSVKVLPLNAVRSTRAETAGVHLMASPTITSLEGQAIVLCINRLHTWKNWLYNFLSFTKARVLTKNAHEHDEYVAITQGISHTTMLSFVLTMQAILADRGLNLQSAREQASPYFLQMYVLMGRMLSQNSELYADIQMYNTYIIDTLRSFEFHFKNLREIIERQDKEAFCFLFEKAKMFLGKESLDTTSKLFDEFTKCMSDNKTKSVRG